MLSLSNRKLKRAACFAVAISAGFACGHARAAAITWDGGATTLPWSDFNNWSDDADPTGDDITFNNVGAVATAGTSTSSITASVTANTLTFVNNPATNTHTVEIASGQTLTLNGVLNNNTLVVGNLTADSVVTNVTFKGATANVGALVINAPTGDLLVNQNTANNGSAAARSTLNLADLGSFTATVNEIRLATTGNSVGELTLSKAGPNLITADTIFVGGGTLRGASGTFLRLGADNTINANLIVVGGGRMSATMDLQSGIVGTPNIVIRGKTGGTSRANIAVADQVGFATGLGSGGSSAISGAINWNGATVDAMVNQLTIGTGAGVVNPNTGRGAGTLSFNAGTMDVTTVTLGRLSDTTTTGGAGSGIEGTLNVGGTGTLAAGTITLGLSLDGTSGANPVVTGTLNVSGNAAVTTTGNVVMGSHTSGTPSTAAVNALLNITGGSVTVGGSITEGAGNNVGTITVNGGALSVTGGSITTDTVNLTAGSIASVTTIAAAVNVGAAFTLSPGGAGNIGALSITGTTNVAGTYGVDLGGATADLLNVTGALDITAASIDFNVLSPLTQPTYVLASYTTLTGTQFANTQDLPAGYTIDYNYLGGNQIALVPEPGSLAVLAAGCGLLALRRRRR